MKERQEWWGRVQPTDITCVSQLLIYVGPKSTDSREFLLSFVDVEPETYTDVRVTARTLV